MRRKIAARMLSQGKSVQEVAEAVGVTSTSVYRWKKALKQGGPGALSAKPHPGRRPRLLPEQKKELEAMLLQGARAAGFPTELWTLPRVAQIIEAHFGVKYHPGHVWYLLRDMGWSAQKPERRARERDEEAIQRWRSERWPQIKKSPPTWMEHRLYRRKWLYAPTCRTPQLGAPGEDTHPVQLGPS